MFENRKISAPSRFGRSLVRLLFVVSFLGVVEIGAAQNATIQPSTKARAVAPSNPILTTGNVGASGITAAKTMPRMRGTTNAQRKAAAAHAAIARAKSKTVATRSMGLNVKSNAIVGIPGAGSGVMPDRGAFYFSGLYPNYANSPLPNPYDTVNCSAPNYCGIRKFVDQLSTPGGSPTATLGQTMPVAVPDTTTFPGADYYEIELGQYTEKLHSDLPPTMLRGYRQTNITPAMQFHYLGPLIIAHTNRPVRVKFTNKLGGTNDPNFATTGKLFIPHDNSVMGAGIGLARGADAYLDNRATIHLHGGNTPWISDGTPHQWTVPAVDAGTTYSRGDSVQFVPDMYFVNGVVVPQCSATVTTNCSGPNKATLPANATNDPGPGSLTFYYTNQQSARLMFYHDHAYGTTRLNVYIGEAAGYLIQDDAELDLINGTNTSGIFATAPPASIPAIEIPLVIQDKTFVPPNFVGGTTVYNVNLLQGGEGYTTATVGFTGGCAVEPTATASVGLSIDPFGQFIYGAITGITLNTYGSGCTSDPVVSITGDGTGAAAFASIATLSQQDPTWDTASWGGQGNFWYPHVYMPNQWPNNPDGSGANPMGRWDYAAWFWPAFTNQYQVRGEIACTNPLDGTPDVCPGTPTAMDPGPAKDLAGGTHLGIGTVSSLTPEAFMDTPMVNGTVYPTLTLDPQAYRFRILSVGNDRTLNLSWFVACGTGGYAPSALAMPCPAPTVAGIPVGTEVGMVPASPTAGYPLWWPTDGRDGGVPDPASAGPSWYAIGNEGGVLPAPTTIPAAPVNYEYDRRSVTITNTSTISLNLMPAERADVIVDFTNFAGKTLILYNDAPAPYPAFDTRYDYYTGDPDQSGAGGAPTTLVGFGPNTRTIMQVKVNSSVTGPATNFNPTALATYLPQVFKATQPVPVVPEPAYSAIYGNGTKFKPIMPTLGANTLTFTPIGATAPVTLTFGQKAIQELFELDYGRMNATLGTEIQLTTYNNQTTIPLGYVDPFTEDSYDSANVSAQPVGVAGDGTQIWEVIHNGVDSHAIHFHLFDVQIIDRVGWDGTLRVPFPNELGWKDTVRMNPLEIDFVALRPMSMTLPFPVPDSVRLLDVTRPAGVDPALSTFTPTNAAFNQMNSVVAMGWEYVWHCHILGHEENDMMREQTFQVPPQTPVNVLAFAKNGGGTNLTFTDVSLSETGFEVQRADDALFTLNPVTLKINGAAPGYNTSVAYTDSSAVLGHTYYYRARSFKPDADYWSAYNNVKLPNLVSAWSAYTVPVTAPAFTLSPLSLTFSSQAYVTASPSKAITITNAGTATGVITNIFIGGANPSDFISNTNCPITPSSVAINGSCTVSIVFWPHYAGVRTATLTITSTDPTYPTLTVPLTGTGGLIPATITASSATINWGAPTPTITPIVTGLASPDTVASLGALTCTTTYTATSNAGNYPSTCSGAVNSAYAFTYVAGRITVNAIAAALTSPTPGIKFAGTSQAFTWNTGGANNYYALTLGTGGAGSTNVYSSGWTRSLGVTVNNLPTTGTTIYARLQTLISGVSQFVDYTFVASGTPAPASLITPTPGSTLTSTSVNFTWTKGNGATSYALLVGTGGAGSQNIFSSGWTNSQSRTVTGLPASGARTIYIRLLSMVNGVQQFIDYTVTSM